MKLRQHTMVREMSFEDIVDYIRDLEAEVRKMRTKSRAHRKSIREMQAKLEQQHLRQLVIDEWREWKKLQNQAVYVGIWPSPAPQNSGSWSPDFGKGNLTITSHPCDTE